MQIIRNRFYRKLSSESGPYRRLGRRSGPSSVRVLPPFFRGKKKNDKKRNEKERQDGVSLETPCTVRNEANGPLFRACLPRLQVLHKQRVTVALHSQLRSKIAGVDTGGLCCFVYIVTIE